MYKMNEIQTVIYRDAIIEARGLNRRYLTLYIDYKKGNIKDLIYIVENKTDEVSMPYMQRLLKLTENADSVTIENLLLFCSHRVTLIDSISACPSCMRKIKEKYEVNV